MEGDGRPPRGRRGQELLLEDIRRVHDLQRPGGACARDRVEDALGAELARRLLGALLPRRPRLLRELG